MSQRKGYRGIIADPINPKVRRNLTADEKRYLDKNREIFQRTPWVRLTSNAVGTGYDPYEWVLAGGLVKSRKAGGSGTGRESRLDGPPYTEKLTGWTSTGFGTQYAGDRRNLPRPGITQVEMTAQGKLGSVQKANINITIPNETDFKAIEKLYMVPGITCILEFGWSDYEGNIIQPSEMTSKQAIRTLIAEKSISTRYGGMLGVIYRFSHEAVSEGGYTATINLLSPSYFLAGEQISTDNIPALIPERRYVERTVANGDLEVVDTKTNKVVGKLKLGADGQMYGERPDN